MDKLRKIDKPIRNAIVCIALLIAAAFGGYWIGNNHYLNRYKKVTDKFTVGNTPSDQELTITNDDEKDYVSSHAMPSLKR